MCALAVDTLFGRYLLTSCTVSPGHYWKYPIWIHLIHVDLTLLNDAACKYFKIYVWFVMWYALFISVMGICQFVDWCVFFPRIIYIVLLLLPLLRLGFVTYFLWFGCFYMRIPPCTLHDIFFIEISEMCMSHNKKIPFLVFSGGYGNASFCSLVDFIWPPFGSSTVIGSVLFLFFVSVTEFYVMYTSPSIHYNRFRFVVYNYSWGRS